MPVPNYDTVPEHWKKPFGPYRQAPAEYGGKWWFVYPFNQAPWLNAQPVEPPTYPAGFLDTFGERPQAKDFPRFGVTYQMALTRWKQNLDVFEGAARDPRVSDAEWDNARTQFLAYSMGEPRPYQNKYGYWIRFPQSRIPWYEIDGYSPAADTGHEIARYQISLLMEGEQVEKAHFFVPPQFLGEE